ncbi:hypothetical protein [Nostoc sp. FACHB-110]|nr:hypothetical protein [Nostoc sp. FACHB-110]
MKIVKRSPLIFQCDRTLTPPKLHRATITNKFFWEVKQWLPFMT